MTIPADERSLRGKVCLVTGATSGIGLVTARELARLGGTVIGVGRSPDRCQAAAARIHEETGGQSVRFLIADLSSQEEIRRLNDELRALTPRLDLLVNNAGGIFLTRQETIDGLEMTFALNHLAYFMLTNLVMDLLKRSLPARIVNVASAAHRGCSMDFNDLQASSGRYGPWRAYQRSKLANILFTRELSRRLDGERITVNAVHPGYVNTEIFRASGVQGWFLRRFADLFAISPEEGVRNSLFAAISPQLEGVSGEYFVNQKTNPGSPQSRDMEVARELWKRSEQLTGLA